MLKKLWIIGLFLFPGIRLFAQSSIIDDSTKQVYGPYTTFYETFDDIKYNRDNLRKIDTLITNFHRFNFVDASDHKLQDLGNIGTAMRPVFYAPPENIGVRSGFDAYRPYYITADQIEFFDTKSPYTLVDAAFGGKGRAITRVMHNRNITPYWDVGIEFRRISALQQVNSKGRGDRQVLSTNYYLHSDYQSKNDKYLGLMSICRFNQKVNESGGVKVSEGAAYSDYFSDAATNWLENAQSQNFRFDVHVYNQYKLRKEFQLYHSFEFIDNRYFFRDNPLTPDELNYYNQILISQDSTSNQAKFNQTINEFGLKGDLANLFYNFYAKFRNWKYIHHFLPYDQQNVESSGGFNLRYDIDSLRHIEASGEYLLGGNYRIGGKYNLKFLTTEYWRTNYKPSIIEQTYFGNHHEWYNNFKPTSSDYLKGSIILNSKVITFAPSLTLTNIKNNITYGYNQEPIQTPGNVQILSPGLTLNLTLFDKFHLDNEIIYTLISGDSAAANTIRIPDVFVNSKIYFGGYLFNKNIYVQTGLDMHYKSDYFAPAYDPTIQQFYLQDNFVVPSYLIADLFLDFQIEQVTVFIKFTHINQKVNDGYFTFPDFTGQKKVLDVGLRWLFFD